MRMRTVHVASIISMSLLIILQLAPAVRGQAEDVVGCEASTTGRCYDKGKSMRFKIIAIFTLIVSSVIGVGLPLCSTVLTILHPDRNPALVIKIFASGVILATGFMQVLPDSWDYLTSQCLPRTPWRTYPWTTLITMFACVLTMMMDTTANAHFKNKGFKKLQKLYSSHNLDGSSVRPHNINIESPIGSEVQLVGDQTPSDSNKDGNLTSIVEKKTQLLRYRTVVQVLTLGVVVHELVIGLSMGVSDNVCTLRSLTLAMCFDQFFEGMGYGGCIVQAEYGIKGKAMLVTAFSTTTALGIVIGIGLQNVYNENSPSALIVSGVLNAASAGVMIYASLVNLLANDFMGPRLQGNIKLQFICYFAAFLGMGIMSLMAKWA